MSNPDTHPNGGTAADGLVAIVEFIGGVCGWLQWKWLSAAHRRDEEWEVMEDEAHLRWTRAVVKAQEEDRGLL